MTQPSWSAAEHYEPFMGRWSRPMATAVVAGLVPAPGLRWLDVGCGTGALSAAVLANAEPASLVGVDRSDAYVAASAAQLTDPRASFRVGDAMSLPLPADAVDRVVSGLVLNFVPDPVAAVSEMRRVLLPGGQAAVYVWDYAKGMQMLRYFWDAAVAEDPAAVALDEGARPLCRPESLQQCFADAGLHDVGSHAVDVPTVFVDFDDYWTPFLGGQGPAAGHCASLSDDARARLRDRLREALPAATDGTISLTARAWVATGVAG